MARCLIGLGANLGDGEATLAAALGELARHPRILRLAQSRWHLTAPIGGPSGQSLFVNAAARFETDLSPPELLALLQQIEQTHGRERRTHWGPRTLDLDLLLYDDRIFSSNALTLPHPRLAWRRFVLEPVVEIAPDWLHPTTALTFAQLLDHVNEAPAYLALCSACWFAKMYLAGETVTRLNEAGVPAIGTTMRGITVFGAAPVSDPEHSFVEHYTDLVPRLADDLRQLVAARDKWVISSYWPEEVRLGATLWFTGEAQRVALEAFDKAFAGLSGPKLVAFVATPDELLLLDPHSPGQVDTYYEQARRLAEQRDALQAFVSSYKSVPVMQLSAVKPEPAIVEMVAAVQAMR